MIKLCSLILQNYFEKQLGISIVPLRKTRFCRLTRRLTQTAKFAVRTDIFRAHFLRSCAHMTSSTRILHTFC